MVILRDLQTTSKLRDCLNVTAFTNVQFLCHDDQKVFSHKGFLSQRSKLLREAFQVPAMLDHVLIVSLPDYSGKAVRKILETLYSGKTEFSTKKEYIEFRDLIETLGFELPSTEITETQRSSTDEEPIVYDVPSDDDEDSSEADEPSPKPKETPKQSPAQRDKRRQESSDLVELSGETDGSRDEFPSTEQAIPESSEYKHEKQASLPPSKKKRKETSDDSVNHKMSSPKKWCGFSSIGEALNLLDMFNEQYEKKQAKDLEQSPVTESKRTGTPNGARGSNSKKKRRKIGPKSRVHAQALQESENDKIEKEELDGDRKMKPMLVNALRTGNEEKSQVTEKTKARHPASCCFCIKLFTSLKDLFAHLALNHFSEKFDEIFDFDQLNGKCPMCPSKASGTRELDRDDLKVHIGATHRLSFQLLSLDNQIKLERQTGTHGMFCGRTMKLPPRQITKKASFQCLHCNHNFQQFSALLNHLSTEHYRSKLAKLQSGSSSCFTKCPLCPEEQKASFIKERDYFIHIGALYHRLVMEMVPRDYRDSLWSLIEGEEQKIIEGQETNKHDTSPLSRHELNKEDKKADDTNSADSSKILIVKTGMEQLRIKMHQLRSQLEERNTTVINVTRNSEGLIQCTLCSFNCATAVDMVKHLSGDHFKDELNAMYQPTCPICLRQNTIVELTAENFAYHIGVVHSMILEILPQSMAVDLKAYLNEDEVRPKKFADRILPKCLKCKATIAGESITAFLHHVNMCRATNDDGLVAQEEEVVPRDPAVGSNDEGKKNSVLDQSDTNEGLFPLGPEADESIEKQKIQNKEASLEHVENFSSKVVVRRRVQRRSVNLSAKSFSSAITHSCIHCKNKFDTFYDLLQHTSVSHRRNK